MLKHLLAYVIPFYYKFFVSGFIINQNLGIKKEMTFNNDEQTV